MHGPGCAHGSVNNIYIQYSVWTFCLQCVQVPQVRNACFKGRRGDTHVSKSGCYTGESRIYPLASLVEILVDRTQRKSYLSLGNI